MTADADGHPIRKDDRDDLDPFYVEQVLKAQLHDYRTSRTAKTVAEIEVKMDRLARDVAVIKRMLKRVLAADDGEDDGGQGSPGR